METAKKSSTQKMIMCAVFTVLIIVGAFVKIPIPVVPFTLQLSSMYLVWFIII